MKANRKFIIFVLLLFAVSVLPKLHGSPFSEKKVTISSGTAKKSSSSKKSNTKTGTIKVGNSTLNVRTSPWGKVIGSLRTNNKVNITGSSGDWYKISYKGRTAYIHKNYVSTNKLSAGKTPVKKSKSSGSSSSYGTVKVSGTLNVRTGPWKSVIGSLRNGNRVKITGSSGDWYKISYKGRTAYIHKNYVSTSKLSAGKTSVKRPGGSSSSSKKTRSGLSQAPCSPMPGRVSSEYGWRTHPITRKRTFHNGIDLPVPSGTRLNALENGRVTGVGYSTGGGRYVRVKYDNGYESFYCHLKSSSVKVGQRVSRGQKIASSDNTGAYTTGSHLHMEIRKNGKLVNPRSTGIRF